MSDDDFMMDDNEDYGFEYESDEGPEPDVDMENQYYNSKGSFSSSPNLLLLHSPLFFVFFWRRLLMQFIIAMAWCLLAWRSLSSFVLEGEIVFKLSVLFYFAFLGLVSSALKEEDPKDAIQGFEKVLTLETEKGEW